jgi:hypothetical protein
MQSQSSPTFSLAQFQIFVIFIVEMVPRNEFTESISVFVAGTGEDLNTSEGVFLPQSLSFPRKRESRGWVEANRARQTSLSARTSATNTTVTKITGWLYRQHRSDGSGKICYGAVAQLGERYVRNVQVVGSIPISSILFDNEIAAC